MCVIKIFFLIFLNVESYILQNISPNVLNNKKNRLNKKILLSEIKKERNETFNSSFDNIKSIEYNEENDMWIIDLKLTDSEEISEFPSFNKFLENKKNDEIMKIQKSKRPFKNLKLLTYSDTIGYSKQWIYDMITYGPSNSYPKFIYDNIYDIREHCNINTNKIYFYIGYFPKGSIYGPYYIGAFELNTQERVLDTNLIMQNPNYYMLDKKSNDKNNFINYKKELLCMSYATNIIFKYDKLKYIPTCERYYLSWFYEDED